MASPEARARPEEAEPERRRGWAGRRSGRRRVYSDGVEQPDEPEAVEAVEAVAESVALIPSQHRVVQRRGAYARALGEPDDEDPRALVSFDEEYRRLARVPPVSLMGRPGFSSPYIPGPVEWGLERYNDDDEDEETGILIEHDGLVSSNWRFWAIMLSIFSAVLFGLLVAGYFFVRDLDRQTQELEVAQGASAQFVRFRVVTRDPEFNTRGDGYVEKEAGRAIFSFGGLPQIEPEQRYVVWAETGAQTVSIANASLFGGSSQYVEARNVPADTIRIFVTVETPVEDELPEQPAGTVLLEAEIP